MDPITKWLVRAASAFIILLGIVITLTVPILTLKLNYQISIFQDTLKESLKLIINSFLM